jgi:5-(carboxyamino)imidazole ribonucleotide mutase
MPKGIPVATFAIGEAGAVNAALFAVAMLANAAATGVASNSADAKAPANSASDAGLLAKLDAYRARQTEHARNMTLPPKA